MKCKHSKFCGGCSDIEKDYNCLLEEKQKYVNSLFADVCSNIHPIAHNYYPYKYRNKLQLAFNQLKGKTIMGFFEEGSIRVVDIDGCILNGDWSYSLISILREYLSRFKIRGFDGSSGVLRYVHARCIENKLQLTLCVTTTNFSGRDWLYKKLCEKFSSVSFYLNINNRTDRAIFDKVFKHIAGDRYLKFDFCGVNVCLEPASFLQVNLGVAEKMYKKASELLNIKDNTTIYDLYCGIGITSLMFAKKAKGVVGIEENSSAINNAKNMAKINNVNNVKFLCGKCEDNVNVLSESDDVVAFLDPARKGCEKAVLDKLKSVGVRTIVYMSCNADSALRDIKILVDDNKYMLTDIFPYDMFSFCGEHLELLAVLQLQ